MNYYVNLKHHYKPSKGWINDPNGLVYFNGYYHIFYQYSPNFEVPWKEPIHWGHARTKDFITFEELPVSLYPDMPYDNGGCWSGTAIVKDDVLYLFYASIYTPEGTSEKHQSVSVAYSKDGIHFEKFAGNPVISEIPKDGCPDFRDPSVICINNKYYCVMASGNVEAKEARLLLYGSDNLTDWKYEGIMCSWDNAKFAECPSFLKEQNGYFLASSLVDIEGWPKFSVLHGDFQKGRFAADLQASPDKGPDGYAGLGFTDHKGRNIFITWIPGWAYKNFERCVGCMSVPREIFVKDGKICFYPVEEVRHLLKDSDPALHRTDDGFVIERTDRESVVHKGNVNDLKIIRDEYIIEVFVNGGETVYSVLL